MLPAPQMNTEVQLRRLVLALFSIGLAGIGAELLALGHFEDQWQLVPFFVISVALFGAALQTFAASPATVRFLRVVAVVLILTGATGIVLHYRGNLEFQLETNPELSGWPLFERILHAKAPPALAPGAMAQLGLLGLIYCFKHPLSRRAA